MSISAKNKMFGLFFAYLVVPCYITLLEECHITSCGFCGILCWHDITLFILTKYFWWDPCHSVTFVWSLGLVKFINLSISSTERVISYLQVEPVNSLYIYEHEETGLYQALKSATVQPVFTWGTYQGRNDPVRSMLGWREHISVLLPEQEPEKPLQEKSDPTECSAFSSGSSEEFKAILSSKGHQRQEALR